MNRKCIYEFIGSIGLVTMVFGCLMAFMASSEIKDDPADLPPEQLAAMSDAEVHRLETEYLNSRDRYGPVLGYGAFTAIIGGFVAFIGHKLSKKTKSANFKASQSSSTTPIYSPSNEQILIESARQLYNQGNVAGAIAILKSMPQSEKAQRILAKMQLS